MRRSFIPSRTSIVACGIALFAMATHLQTSQASFTYTLTQSNAAGIGPDGGNYGTIKIEDAVDVGFAGFMRFTFNINPARSGDRFQEIAVNVNTAVSDSILNGATYTYALLPSGVTWTKSLGGNMDGFGVFRLHFGGTGNDDRASSGVITIGNLGANATFGNFLMNSSGGAEGPAYFAGHLVSPGITGYVGSRSGDGLRDVQVEATPCPPALLLAVTGMGCLGIFRRFRKTKTVA